MHKEKEGEIYTKKEKKIEGEEKYRSLQISLEEFLVAPH